MLQFIGTGLTRLGSGLGRLWPGRPRQQRWRERLRPARERLGRLGDRLGLQRISRQQIQRRLVQDSILVGTVLTLLVVALDLAGAFTPLEWWLYDRRASNCQFFTPPPTDTLVHIDIDDAALDSLSAEKISWPWNRGVWAELLDEIRLAGPKAVALDIIFPEPNQLDVKTADGRRVAIDYDVEMAAALKRLGCVLLPTDTPIKPPPPALTQAMRDLLVEDLEMGEGELAEALLRRGFPAKELAERVKADFVLCRKQAMLQRIHRELDRLEHERETGRAPADLASPQAAAADIRRRLLKAAPSPLASEFEIQFRKARDASAMHRFFIPPPPGFPRAFPTTLEHANVQTLTDAAVASGFVNYVAYADGTVRSVPLFLECEGELLPQMGFSLACMMQGIDVRQVRYADGAVVLPRPGGGDLSVPVRTFYSRNLRREIPLLMEIPWFGGDVWETMYDYPERRRARQHMSLDQVWGLCLARRSMARNNEQADGALKAIWAIYDPAKLDELLKNPRPADDVEGRLPLIRAALEDDFVKAAVEAAREKPESQRGPEERITVESATALRHVLEENPKLQRQLASRRADLRAAVNGRAVLIGSIATGLISDEVSTSIHRDQCPGVVVHGVIYNAFMTGEMWRHLPGWVTVAWTLALGLLATFTTARLSPAPALLAAVLAAAGFLALNFLLLFDYANLILGAAAPVVATVTVWTGCTLTRFVVERWERALITKRFRNYVDPKLVDYVTANPDQIKFEGQTREMTVVFTDIGNFTPLTAKLGEKTVPLLNEFLGRMVPVIRRHNGLVNKFLGDGIMFFYGAPEQNPHHARDAMATILDMQQVLAGFNRDLVSQGLPGVTLRAGVSTGSMIVGDAGSADTSDYTVLGDAVNYGSRLEAANKAFGTDSLLTARTIELGGDGFVVRPVGKPAVVGRHDQTAEMVYEVLARAGEATEAQRRLAALTRDVVEHYVAARFRECLEALDRMEREVGEGNKFVALYRGQCRRYLEEGPPEVFNGQIVLTTK